MPREGAGGRADRSPGWFSVFSRGIHGHILVPCGQREPGVRGLLRSAQGKLGWTARGETIPPSGDRGVPGETVTHSQPAQAVFRHVYLRSSEARLVQGKDVFLLPSGLEVLPLRSEAAGVLADTFCCSGPALAMNSVRATHPETSNSACLAAKQ